MSDTQQLSLRVALLRGELAPAAAQVWLADARFDDWQQAWRTLQQLAANDAAVQALAQVLPHLMLALSESAQPDRVLTSVARFVQHMAEPTALLTSLAQNPRTVEMLVRLFDGSQFLTEILLRNPEYFAQLSSRAALSLPLAPAQFLAQAKAAANAPPLTDPHLTHRARLNALRRWQRLALLRIGAADLLDLFDLATVLNQLTALADSLAQTCLQLCAELTETDPRNFVVLGLGKLGGQELNYSSDIDLMFLASDPPETYRPMAERLVDALGTVLEEGFLYRVDMRLRPWGRSGPLVSAVADYDDYLHQHARLWEKQMLMKARPIAGNLALGHQFLAQVAALMYSAPPDQVREAVQTMRQRTEENLKKRGQDWAEVKEGQGSIRDIEFLVQYLQLAHGDELPELRTGHTLSGLQHLYTARLLDADEYRVLTDSYVFLRTVEHHLQLMHYRQTHLLPNNPLALQSLARRLQFSGQAPGEQFVMRYNEQRAAVRAIYARHLLNQAQPEGGITQRHVARMVSDYQAAFSPRDIQRHAELAASLNEADLLKVEALPIGEDLWQLTLVAYDYLGELSLICGLLFVNGLSIVDGHVFTYEPSSHGSESRRKIVDVFTVRAVQPPLDESVWVRYREELAGLLHLLHAGDYAAAQGALVKRVAMTMTGLAARHVTLYPVDIEIDNASSPDYTVMEIDSLDTPGFLYEFANALALQRVHIGRVTVSTVAERVHDTVYVTDAKGRKITQPQQERELRAATVLVKYFTHLLPSSPNPELALTQFRAFLTTLFDQPDWPDTLIRLERPEVLAALARLLGVSDFLWSDFLRMQYANLLPLVQQADRLADPKTRAQMAAELDQLLQNAEDDPAARREILNTFKDREMFRIDMRPILGQASEYGQFSDELTSLAEVVVSAGLALCAAELDTQYGLPLTAEGQPGAICVVGLGKCGGRELGFASDIELMVVYAENGQTSGPRVITSAEYYDFLVSHLLQTIQARREGIFELDLRLRPYGKAGSLAVSLAAFDAYFAPGGPAWDFERQALIRLRPIYGDPALGATLVAHRDAYVYTGQFDAAAMRAMRERQLRHLVKAGTINLKYSPGGLADMEYLVQALQMRHGHTNPSLRLTNTREAMAALSQAGVLDPDDYARLRLAHIFVRRMINALRMVRGNAKDVTMPSVDSEDFAFLARRLDYGAAYSRLYDDLVRHTTWVQALSQRMLG